VETGEPGRVADGQVKVILLAVELAEVRAISAHSPRIIRSHAVSISPSRTSRRYLATKTRCTFSCRQHSGLSEYRV
jgi:hypothetical protein